MKSCDWFGVTIVLVAITLAVGAHQLSPAPTPPSEAVAIHREIVAVHERRLAEYESLHARKLASSSEVAAVQLELLNAKLRLAYEKAGVR